MFTKFFAERKARRLAKYEAAIAAMPMPYCGDKREHLYWTTNGQRWGCPACAFKMDEEHKAEKESQANARLAKAIVDEFERRLK